MRLAACFRPAREDATITGFENVGIVEVETQVEWRA